MTTKRISRKEAERQEFIGKLREQLPPGSTVWTVIRAVSSSGMSRQIDCFHFWNDDRGQLRKAWLSFWIAKAIGFRFNEKRDCLSIGGCGMDMGFHVVSTLSRVLYPQGAEVEGRHVGPDYVLSQEWI